MSIDILVDNKVDKSIDTDPVDLSEFASMNDSVIRNQIIKYSRAFNTSGLSVGTSGNISVLTGTGFLITPSAIPYEELVPDDLVVMSREGSIISGRRNPSSEWRFHRKIYNERDDVTAVVHVHPPFATAIACTRQDIPAFHYMIARAGGDSIRCSEYATIGTEELSVNALNALQGRNSCLLANHGVIAVGTDLQSAFLMAQETEELAKHYTLCKLFGKPVLLDEKEMQRILEKFKNYGI